MAEVFNKIDENRAMLGKGSALYMKDEVDGKYKVVAPLIKVPFIKKSIGEVEIKVACSDTITKIEGVTTLEASEAEVYLHRDVIEVLEELNGKPLSLLSMAGDKTGYFFEGTISYSASDIEMDSAWQGTIKITPNTEPKYEKNCFPFLKPTAQFKSVIPAEVVLNSTTGTFIKSIEMKWEDTTFTAKSTDMTVASAVATDGKLTITGVKEGSTIVELTSVGEGYALWKTHILVIVPKASAPINE